MKLKNFFLIQLSAFSVLYLGIFETKRVSDCSTLCLITDDVICSSESEVMLADITTGITLVCFAGFFISAFVVLTNENRRESGKSVSTLNLD